MLISSFSDVFLPEVHSSTQNVTGLIVSFIVLAIIIYGGGQLLLNGFVKRVSTELRNKRRDIGLMYKASVILGILSYRFLPWFKTRRNSITLLFFIGSGMAGVNLAVGMVIHSYYIESVKPDIITEQSQIPAAYPKITPQSVGILSPLYLYAFFIPLNLAYLFAWGGVLRTLTLLFQHFGRDKVLDNYRNSTGNLLIFSIPNNSLTSNR